MLFGNQPCVLHTSSACIDQHPAPVPFPGAPLGPAAEEECEEKVEGLDLSDCTTASPGLRHYLSCLCHEQATGTNVRVLGKKAWPRGARQIPYCSSTSGTMQRAKEGRGSLRFAAPSGTHQLYAHGREWDSRGAGKCPVHSPSGVSKRHV